MNDIKTYYCSNCGGIMEFDAASQNLKCPNCGTEIEIEHNPGQVVEHTLDSEAKNKIKVEEKSSTNLQCVGCGAIVEVDSLTTATECPYCESNYVLVEKQVDTIKPDGVLPFKITKEDVGPIFNKWIKSRALAPNALKGLYQRNKIQGIYIPYWTFDARVDASYTAYGGKNRTVRTRNSKGEEVTRVYTDWKFIGGNISKSFDDILVKASNSIPENLADSLFFNTADVKSYSPDYISGYCSEIYNIDLATAQKDALAEMKTQVESACIDRILRSYDCQKGLKVDMKPYNETYKYILIPIYSTAYHYNGKQYNVLINGQSGELRGEYPKSFYKVAGLVLLVIFVIAILFYFMNS